MEPILVHPLDVHDALNDMHCDEVIDIVLRHDGLMECRGKLYKQTTEVPRQSFKF